MTDAYLGSSPATVTLILTEGSDFVATIRAKDGVEWSSTAVVTISVGSASWVGDVDGTFVRFQQDKADVAAVIAEDPTTWQLSIVDGTTDVIGARGEVVIYRA